MWKRPCRKRKSPCYNRNSQSQNNKSVAERMNRSVMTEICESVRVFTKIVQRGNLGRIAVV